MHANTTMIFPIKPSRLKLFRNRLFLSEWWTILSRKMLQGSTYCSFLHLLVVQVVWPIYASDTKRFLWLWSTLCKEMYTNTLLKTKTVTNVQSNEVNEQFNVMVYRRVVGFRPPQRQDLEDLPFPVHYLLPVLPYQVVLAPFLVRTIYEQPHMWEIYQTLLTLRMVALMDHAMDHVTTVQMVGESGVPFSFSLASVFHVVQ